jgi:hypothetical protein
MAEEINNNTSSTINITNSGNSNVVTATSAPGSSGIITASSNPNVAVNPISKPVTPVLEKTLTGSQENKIIRDNFAEAMLEKVTPEAEREAAKLFKTLMQSSLLPFNAGDFSTGNMLFYRYDAKDKDKTFDKTPLIIVLSKSKGYVLGLNLHWTPVPLRITLLKIILKLNKDNIRKNQPITISYAMLKPMVNKMGLGPVIRLYIFNRISRRGLVIPATHWLIAAKLRAESFNNGQSAEQAYRVAVNNYRRAKLGRKRREHIYK